MSKNSFEFKPLSFRGKVQIVAPSSSFNRPLFNAGITFLKLNKIKPSWNSAVFETEHYTAGSAKLRAEDLVNAFLDKDAEAVWAARGGFGAIHLLPLLDEKINELKQNHKPLIGFSDITILQNYLFEKCGIVSVHGPNITTIEQIDKYSQTQILNILSAKESGFKIFSKYIQVIQGGKAKGIVRGGNLSSLASLMGTKYEPNFDNSILFLEDTGEVPYRIDRLLTQMNYAEKFKKIKGLILGDFSYKEKNPPAEKQIYPQMIVEKMGIPKNIPVIANFPAGHGKQNMAFLIGAVAELDAEGRTVSY